MAVANRLISRPVSVVIPVISSLAGTLRSYLMSVLPTEYVKDYHISTEMPMSRVKGRNRFRTMTRSNVEKRQLPLMSINVEPTSDSSEFSSGVTFWTSTRFLRDPTKLSRLIADDQGLRFAGYECERMVLRFNVSFLMETEFRANELMMYLRRSLPMNQLVYLNDIDIATEIPGDIIRTMWSDMGLDPAMPPEEVEYFNQYLRRVTAGNVEPMINSASGRLTYTFAYRANPLVKFTSTPTVSVQREGNVVYTAQVDLPVEFDISVPVAYAYRAEESLGGSLPSGAIEIGTSGDGAYFSASTRLRPPEDIEGELQLTFFTAIVTSERDPARPFDNDVTDLSVAVSDRIKVLVDRLIEGYPNPPKVKGILWLDGNQIDEKYWSLDLETWLLTIERPVLQYRQKYHFGLYADVSDIKTLAPEERRDQPLNPMIRPS